MFTITRSGWAGIALFLAALVALPLLSGGHWIKIFTSTACFVLATGGVAFMYARLGMVSLGQVALRTRGFTSR